MRKSQIDAMALTAMREAVAEGLNEYATIEKGAVEIWRYDRTVKSPNDAMPSASAIYNKHFKVMGPN